MKKLLVIFLALTFVLAMISLAFGSRYNAPLYSTFIGQDPHGGYADTTDFCKDCHAVHLATGNYKLLRNGSTNTDPCSFCHGSGGASTKTVRLNTSGHGGNPDITSISAPDDVSPPYTASTQNPFNCATCHSVHDKNTIAALTNAVAPGTTNRMLRYDPDSGDSAPSYGTGDTVSLSVWCQNCHGANYGTYGQQKQVREGAVQTPAYGHDATSAGQSVYAPITNNTYALVASPGSATVAPRCNQCHAAGAATPWVTGQNGQVPTGGTENVSFPHAGYANGTSLLKSSANVNTVASGVRLDDVCNDCHYTPSLP